MRIWVTGVGLITALGPTVETTWTALLEGRRGLRPVTLFDTTGCRSEMAGELTGLSVADVAPEGMAESWSRTDAMAVVAAREALAHAGIGAEDAVDLVVGGTTAGMYETEEILVRLHRSEDVEGELVRMLSHPLSATMDRLVETVHPHRRARVVCSACSSGSNAVVLAASWLRAGKSERVLAGGADGLCRVTFTGFSALGAMAPDRCKPFDRDRDGLTLGEGAAFLLLETEEAARRRGAEPLVELRGWAVGAEAHHITNPEASGATAAAVMRLALERAGLSPTEVDYVNAHGTATKLNDEMESRALATCFGDELTRLGVSSSKGQLGHTLGAAGAVEAVLTTLTVARGVMPPTCGLENVDPSCEGLRLLREAEPAPVRAAMSNSFGFGGSDAVLVFGRAEGASPPGVALPAPHRVFVLGAGLVGPLGVGGLDAARAYAEEGEPPQPGAIAFEAGDHLDLRRARRIDRTGRMLCTAMGLALDEGGRQDDEGLGLGAAIGGAFGAVDACSAYVNRIQQKGARFASPAVFPNLLPSSAVAHASVYHRLRGVVVACADLELSAEAGLVTAADLLAAGEAERMLAGGAEPASSIADTVLGSSQGARSEGAAVLLLGREASPNRAPLAELIWWDSWRRREDARAALARLEPPPFAALFLGSAWSPAAPLLEGSPWGDLPARVVGARAGHHEAVGGFAAAAAVEAIQRGEVEAALVLGLAEERASALLFQRVEEA